MSGIRRLTPVGPGFQPRPGAGWNPRLQRKLRRPESRAALVMRRDLGARTASRAEV